MSEKSKSNADTKSRTKSKAKTKKAVKKTSAKKTGNTVKKSTARKKRSRNTNLLKLWAEMNKMAKDAVDREILKRFKIIIDTNEDDITKVKLQMILKEPKNVDLKEYHESLQPYIKHYLFMLKRSKKEK